MKFVETKTQFITYDEDLTYDDSVKVYNLTETNDWNEKYQYDFPQYELSVISKGEERFKSAIFINYRGIELRRPIKERKDFIIRVLNAVKKNENYQAEMRKICREHFSEEWYNRFESILNTPNIKAQALEKEKVLLKEENNQLKERLKEISELAST